MTKALTPKQERFVDEYLIDLNATQAAVRAGYANPNKQGPRLLVNDGVALAIEKGREKQSKSSAVDAQVVLQGLLKEAKGEGITDTTASARVSAWEKLGRHVGIFEKDNSQRAPVIPQTIALVAPKLDDDATD